MAIRAIDTVYNGFRFRSRLEARWAIYFDLIGLEYQYEPDGLSINGMLYLPDFYVPKYRAYVEIKSIGALIYDYDGKPLQSGRENSEKYNNAAKGIAEAGFEYVVLSGTPLEILNDKDGAFWYTTDEELSGFVGEVGTFKYEYEAEGASFSRFEHGENPYEEAKRHAEKRRRQAADAKPKIIVAYGSSKSLRQAKTDMLVEAIIRIMILIPGSCYNDNFKERLCEIEDKYTGESASIYKTVFRAIITNPELKGEELRKNILNSISDIPNILRYRRLLKECELTTINDEKSLNLCIEECLDNLMKEEQKQKEEAEAYQRYMEHRQKLAKEANNS